jgi:hypothetical protein
VDGPSVSMPQLLVDATRLEGDDRLVARSVRPSRVVAAAGMGMVNTSILGRSTQGAAPTGIEAGAPERHFLRAIQIRQQHNIVTPGSTNLVYGLTWQNSPWFAATSSSGHACTSGSMHSHPSLSALSARARGWKRMSL